MDDFSRNDELSMLGWLMEHPETAAVLDVAGVWHSDSSAALYDLIVERFAGGSSTNSDAIGSSLGDPAKVRAIGGWDGLAACNELKQKSALGAKELAGTLKRRAGAMEFQRIVRAAMSNTESSTEDKASVLIEQLSGLIARSEDPGMRSIQKIMLDLQAEDADLELNKRQRYFKTGLVSFDEKFGGIIDRGVTIIMGVSGMGKTSVLNAIALGMARQGRHVVLHGTETSYNDRGNDMALSLAGVAFKDYYGPLGYGNLPRHVRESVVKAREVIHEELPMTISGARGATVDVVCGRIQSMRKAGKCDVAVIDYLQDFRETSKKDVPQGNRQVQVSYASRRLKELSNDLGIPIIVGAQVSNEKNTNTNVDPRPQLYDVQWSSQAHQDAEEVFVLYREDYYTARFDGWSANDKFKHGCIGMVEIIQRKGRKAGPGTAEELFHGPTKWVGEPWPDIRTISMLRSVNDWASP